MKYVNEIVGTVVRGQNIGSRISFPTINVKSKKTDIDFGVYACVVELEGAEYIGAMHYGPRKVIGENRPSLEVYLLDFKGDLYNKEVNIKVYDKIRETRDFSDLQSLKDQIEKDVEEVRKVFKSKND